MATFYSPDGNPEIWDEKPEGYFTQQEWDVAHPVPEPTLEEQASLLLQHVDAYLKFKANSRGYDSIDSASKYIGNTINPRWAAEGEALRDWAILVYSKCYAILDAVTSGEREVPTAEELLDMLPKMAWPA